MSKLYDMVVVKDFYDRHIYHKKGTRCKIIDIWYSDTPNMDDTIQVEFNQNIITDEGLINQTWHVGLDKFSKNVKFIGEL